MALENMDILSKSSSYGVWRPVLDGFSPKKMRCFLDSVRLDVESPLSVEFLGAVDGQQLLVIEGSCCTFSLTGC